MKIWMKRTLGDYKAGETYEIADWEGRRFINAGAANPVLSEKQKKVDTEVKVQKKAARKKRGFGRQSADPLTLGETTEAD